MKLDKKTMAMGAAALLALGYVALNNKKNQHDETLMARSQKGGVSKNYPLVLFEGVSWQGNVRPLEKNEMVMIMEQFRSERGEITRKWHHNSFKCEPRTRIRLTADLDSGKSVRTVDSLVGFNTASLNEFIFSNSKIFGVSGLDLNSQKGRYTRVYMKVA